MSSDFKIPSDESEIKRQFQYLARELSVQFPDLDLRFNLRNNTRTFRFLVGEQPDNIFEIQLGLREANELLQEAIFTLKEALSLYDS